MKANFGSLFGLLLLCSCISKQSISNCENFKTGNFRINSKFDNSVMLIRRNDSSQIETNKSTGMITKAKIHWTSPCEYELRYQAEGSTDNIAPLIKVTPLKVKIKTATPNYCVFEAKMEGVSLNYVDTLWRINE